MVIQIIVIFIVAYGGYRVKSLTFTGAVATVGIGSAVALGFGYKGLGLLGVFFLTSSLWSKYKREQKSSLQQMVQKGDQRDYVQVLANGSVPAIASILYAWSGGDVYLIVFISAICAANADTWASEIGSLSKKQPILVSSLRRVKAGTSGAVSLLGTIAALLGSMVISLVSLILWEELSLSLIFILIGIGFLGNLFDTLLGALFQVNYICSICGMQTEKTYHCQIKTDYHKGIRFCNNDFINFLSILLASIIGGILFYIG
ncbi:DUF92 domain-containing protein [Litchfieldia salsa]|uniref:TIGR00297 family protein n=1 Tax=Litchfieldia salsa TaxID=930152 RepID=A0A1H0VBJ3_9BACI|nr:DUF92 domain-containing protein [Litchfieldia salsa]SDP75929.1 TIGR00297 family protein [Litchfieldia salsa]